MLGEMACKVELVVCYVLYTLSVKVCECNNLVKQLHGETVRHHGLNLLQVHYRRNRRIICRSLDIIQDNVLAQYAGKLVVDGVARAGSNDTALDRFAYKCQVTYYVKQFVACRLIVPLQGLVHDVTKFGGIHCGYTHNLTDLVIAFLGHLTFVNDNGVVKVTSLDKAQSQQRLYLTDKDECTALGYLSGEITHVIQ